MSATETSESPKIEGMADQEMARLIQKRDAVLKELGQIEQELGQILAKRQEVSPIRYAEAGEALAASSRIFEENTELFKKLAK